jgi:CBS domain containing-hemolysin-like protein
MEISLNPLVGIILSLLLIGYFQGLEIAFISANRLNIELRKKQGKRSGSVLSYFIDNPEKFIGTTIVVINLLIVIYGLFIANFFIPIFEYLHITNEYAIIAIIVSVAALLLLFVVFLFKAIFKANNDSIINNSFVIVTIQTVSGIFGSIANLFTSLSEWLLQHIFDVRIQKNKDSLTKIDLEQFVDQSKEHDTEEQEFDTTLFENALSLSETKIRQCLIPRKEIVALSDKITIDEVRKQFVETKLSKLLVYKDNIDNIIGYIHQLDMFKNVSSITEILLPIPAVPESMSASDLINKFSKERKSIAWVVDEFGGTAGIVTMEDLLEELFGDIKDEYDIDELVEKQISKEEFIFSGRLEMDHLKEKYAIDFEDIESETLSGFIIQEHETIPKQRERIVIGNYEFEILNVSATRIEMVKMRLLK